MNAVKVALYARVSTNDRDQNPETQLRPLREHARTLAPRPAPTKSATTLQTLRSSGCGIRSLQEPWIDTTTPIGEAMYHITIAWAQLEKRQLTERVKAGMERAKAEGKNLGRPPRTKPVTEHPAWPKVLQALEGSHINRAEAAKKLHVRKSVLIEALESFRKGGPENEGASEPTGTA